MVPSRSGLWVGVLRKAPFESGQSPSRETNTEPPFPKPVPNAVVKIVDREIQLDVRLRMQGFRKTFPVQTEPVEAAKIGEQEDWNGVWIHHTGHRP